MNNIYERIRTIYNDSAMSQREFALKAGVTDGYISKIINKNLVSKRPPRRLLRQLSKIFGINYHWLETGEGAMYALDETGVPMVISERDGLPYGLDPEAAQLVGMLADIYRTGTDDDRAVIYGHIRRIHDKIKGRICGDSGGPDQPGFCQGEEAATMQQQQGKKERGAA